MGSKHHQQQPLVSIVAYRVLVCDLFVQDRFWQRTEWGSVPVWRVERMVGRDNNAANC
jgi:hypothetical protein